MRKNLAWITPDGEYIEVHCHHSIYAKEIFYQKRNDDELYPVDVSEWLIHKGYMKVGNGFRLENINLVIYSAEPTQEQLKILHEYNLMDSCVHIDEL